MRVDVHAHIMSPAFHEAMARLPGMIKRPNLWGFELARDGKHIASCNETWFDRDHPIREMDKKGFDMRLVSLAPPNLYIFPPVQQPEVARWVNDETIAYCKGRTDRLRALPSLPLGDPTAALKELDRIAGALEVAGVAIGSNVSGVPLSDERFEPVWAKINSLKIPVVEHPLHPTFAGDIQDRNLSVVLCFWFDTQLCVTRMILNGVFERYPDFPFIVAHTGGGLLGVMHRLDNSSARTPEAKANMKKSFAAYAKNLYFDSCARYAPTIAHALDFAGAERVLYGTDYPYVYVDDSYLKDMDIPAATRVAIDGGNAQKVFKL